MGDSDEDDKYDSLGRQKRRPTFYKTYLFPGCENTEVPKSTQKNRTHQVSSSNSGQSVVYILSTLHLRLASAIVHCTACMMLRTSVA